MAQFTVYRNKNSHTKKEIPFLVDVQSDFLHSLSTRVVIPLYTLKASGVKSMTRLTPQVKIEDKKYVCMTPQLAGIAIHDLGESCSDLAEYRAEIISAMDLLVFGF